MSNETSAIITIRPLKVHWIDNNISHAYAISEAFNTYLLNGDSNLKAHNFIWPLGDIIDAEQDAKVWENMTFFGHENPRDISVVEDMAHAIAANFDVIFLELFLFNKPEVTSLSRALYDGLTNPLINIPHKVVLHTDLSKYVEWTSVYGAHYLNKSSGLRKDTIYDTATLVDPERNIKIFAEIVKYVTDNIRDR